MGVLIIDPKACQRVIEYARAHVVEVNNQTFPDLKPVGDNPEHVINLGTYRIVFSFENNNGKFCRHLSVSTHRKGMFPSPFVIEEIMNLFEFEALEINLVEKNDNLVIWVESEYGAINVVEVVKE